MKSKSKWKKVSIHNKMALDILTAAQGGTCAIIKVESCVCIPYLSGNVLTALNDLKNQVKAMLNENIPFWTWVLSWVKGNWWKTIFTTYSCLDSSAFWTLNCTMYYELCNPKVDVILPNWQSESQGAIYPYEWCSQYELGATRGGTEEEIHRVWTPSEACPCWSCLAASPMDSTLCLVPVGTTMER